MFKFIVIYIAKRKYVKEVKQAKKEADEAHELTGKRFYVVSTSDKIVRVINNDSITAYNKVCPKHKRINYVDVIKSCIYSTK